MRAHPIFESPVPVDLGQKTAWRIPDSWRAYPHSPALHQSREGFVEVLPLLSRDFYEGRAGWCTSGWMLAESPEVEVMCGGINTKRPSHAGIWRQGNLLHFGFETPPSRLNENGRAVLVNSIAYISRFTEDFPLTRTPSVFADDRYPRARASVEELLEAFPPKNLAGNFDPDLHVERMTKPTFEQWFRKSFAYLHPGELGLLEIDNDAEAFKMSFGDPAFVRMAVAALDEEGEKAKLAHRLLQRYVDQPPAQNASFEKWAEWFDENCDYLFFSEASGYKWHIDTLAKDRGVPTEKLRGPLRATLPPPRLVTAER